MALLFNALMLLFFAFMVSHYTMKQFFGPSKAIIAAAVVFAVCVAFARSFVL